jgi:transposase
MRSSSNRRHTTVREHMPSSHRRYAGWTPERIRRQAGEIGRNAAALIEIIMRERSHPEQGFRASVGIIRLAKSYGRDRLPLCKSVAQAAHGMMFATITYGGGLRSLE